MLLLFKGVYGNNLHVAYTHRFSPLHQIFIFIGTLIFTEYYWYSDSVPFLMVTIHSIPVLYQEVNNTGLYCSIVRYCLRLGNPLDFDLNPNP